MRKGFILLTALGALFAFGPTIGHADTIVPAKLKSKKVLGDLVPAYACDPFGTDQSQCSDSSQVKVCAGDFTTKCAIDADCPGLTAPCIGNITLSQRDGNDCTFEKGKFKILVGKDAQFQIKKLKCGAGNPAEICTQIATYSTIADHDLDKKGVEGPAQSCPTAGGDLAGTSSYAIAQVGTLPCKTLGNTGTVKCKGTVPVTTGDPCSSVDKVSQLERVEVFDGPASGTVSPVPGVTLGACCGVEEQVGGGFTTSGTSCTGSEVQTILAVPGTVTQGG